MLKRKYNITYGHNEMDKPMELGLLIDGNDYQLEVNGESMAFKENELSELIEYLHAKGFNAQMLEDVMAILEENDKHHIREDINYLLVELEQSLEETDHRIMNKFFELKNSLNRLEQDTADDIDEFEDFEDEFDLN